MRISPCTNCESGNLFKTQVSAGGGHAPNYLPRLGKWWVAPKFDVVVCRDCGLTRLFADDEARNKLGQAKGWTRVVN